MSTQNMSIHRDRAARFQTEGWISSTAFLEAKELDALRSEASGFFSPSKTGRRPDRVNDGFDVINNVWKTESRFRSVAFHPTLTRNVAALLGVNHIVLLRDSVYVKPVTGSSELHWHQDYQAAPADPPTNVVACWMALDDVDIENGAMQMAIGSPGLGRLVPTNLSSGRPKVSGMNDSTVPDPMELGLQVVTVALKAGEISYHNALTLHRSGQNTSGRPRRAYVVRYASADALYARAPAAPPHIYAIEHAGHEMDYGKRIGDLGIFPVIECS